MSNFIFFIFLIAIWVFARIMLKEPILPWGNKKVKPIKPNLFNSSTKKKKETQVEQVEDDADFIRNLLSDIKDISHHMIRRNDDTFVLFAEVRPCNYFLLSSDEQAAIDRAFETWLATLDYHVTWYLQNRYIDLSEPMREMKENMKNGKDLPERAKQYGEDLLADLEQWQNSIPRFETKRYILFTHKVNPSTIVAEDEEEFEGKLYDKAFAELTRRLNASRQSLKRSKMEVEMLANDGIIEVLYHALNRKKAIKHKFKDIAKYERLAEFVTADKDLRDIEIVKGMIEDDQTTHQEKIS